MKLENNVWIMGIGLVHDKGIGHNFEENRENILSFWLRWLKIGERKYILMEKDNPKNIYVAYSKIKTLRLFAMTSISNKNTLLLF